MMELKSLNCNNCGAQLEVPDVAKFVTCSHCDSQLAVRHTESVWYTEKIEQLAHTTSEIGEQLARMEYRNELERLDKAWAEEREQYIKRDQQGNETTATDRRHGFVVIGMVGVVMTLVGLATLGWVLAFGGVCIVLVGVFEYHRVNEQERAYEAAHEKYLIRRGRVRCNDFRVKSQQEQE